jgi:uncharacterized protein (TIRG00374 family)
MSALKRRAVLGIAAVATVLYAGAGLAVDANRFHEAMQSLGWIGCVTVLALSLANYLIRFQRWQLFLARLGHALPGWQHVTYYLSGFAFTVSPAKAGEAVRSIYLREHGVSYAESIAALFVERLQDLLAMVLLASLLIADLPRYRLLLAGVLALVLAVILSVNSPLAQGLLERLALGVRAKRLARALGGVVNLLRSSRQLLRPRLLLLGTAVGVLSWGAEGLGFLLICRGLDMHIGLLPALGIYALAVLAGSATFFLPAGLGGTELVMTTLLVSHGASLHSAIVATWLCRLATLWFAVVIGIVAATAVEFRARSTALRSTS